MRARWFVVFLMMSLAGCSSQPPVQPALERQLAAYEGARSGVIHRLYDTQGGALIWTGIEHPTEATRGLLRELCAADRDGLSPGAYFLDSIQVALRRAYAEPSDDDSLQAERLAALDLLLTKAFVTYTGHLLNGRIQPEAISSKWHLNDPAPDFAAVLRTALREGVRPTLDTLVTRHRGYAPLRQALNRYRSIAASGGWPDIPPGDALDRDDRGARIALLRRRLAATGDLAPNAPDDSAYTEEVEAAVRRFQHRHGLDPDGVVHGDDLAALNVPAAARVNQLRLNLERHRWLPEQMGERFVFVHLTDFRLSLYRRGNVTFETPIVIGERGWQTPAFVDTMSHVVFRPHWNVPAAIAQKQLLPQIKRDSSFLERNGYEVVNATGEVVDPDRLNPEALERYTVRIRQRPGPANALGQIKFMLPNRFNIYLHDTPEEHLFARNRRSFSHGCIRVGDPVAFADHVLSDDEWPRDSIRTAMRDSTQHRVDLNEPMPVYIVYLTAWATDEGTAHFRRDLYDYDPALQRALSAPTPAREACTAIRAHLTSST